MSKHVRVQTSPSLALVKYWGKAPGGTNLPATSNLAVGLDALRTLTEITFTDAEEDQVFIHNSPQALQPYLPLFDLYRTEAGVDHRFFVQSENSFPTGAGIASSSSGFAALAIGLNALVDTGFPESELSAHARIGSGSASRAVYGGFTSWQKGTGSATRFLSANHWPELRVLVVVVSEAKKAIGSRAAMERCRTSSPMYEAWIEAAEEHYALACRAVNERDLESLGTVMRESYLAMFATMFSARPPFIYWLPESVRILRALEELRADGIGAWETMDAGPQVKILTTADQLDAVGSHISRLVPQASLLSSPVGGEPIVEDLPDAGGQG